MKRSATSECVEEKTDSKKPHKRAKYQKLTSHDVSIAQLETKKDKIKQPLLATKEENMIIPPLGSSVLISGKSGSGKSTLLANLIKDKRFYKGFFKKIFLFSPTANGDDIQKQLDIPAKHVFTDLEEAPELLEVIIDAQKGTLERTTADKADQWAIIFDDVIGDVKFMNSKAFTQCFYQVRHICCTTFICTQHFNRVPRICRLQANFVMYFKGSMSETETLVEEFAPPGMNKNEFRRLIVDATSDGFDFLTINMKVGWDTRFRKNLDELIPMTGVENYVPETNQLTQQDNASIRQQSPEGSGEQLQQDQTQTGARGRIDSNPSRSSR